MAPVNSLSDLMHAIKAGQAISTDDMVATLVGQPVVMESVLKYMQRQGYSDFDIHTGIATPGKAAD